MVPALIEKAMAEAEVVSQALVFGSDRPYNVAILVPNWEKLQAYGVEHTGGEVTGLSTPEEIGKPPRPPPPPPPRPSRVSVGLVFAAMMHGAGFCFTFTSVAWRAPPSPRAARTFAPLISSLLPSPPP